MEEYAEMIERNSNQQVVSLNSRQNGILSHKMLTSPRSSKFIGVFSGGLMKSTKDYSKKRLNFESDSVQKDGKSGNSI